MFAMQLYMVFQILGLGLDILLVLYELILFSYQMKPKYAFTTVLFKCKY